MTDKVFSYAIKLLSRKDYFESELKEKLKSRFDNVDIDYALKKLKDLGYLDDNKTKQNYIRSQSKKGFGQYLIKRKLLEKGIEVDVVEIDDYIIEDDLKKKIKSKYYKYQRDKEKTIAYFYRKGYPYERIKTLLSEVLEDESDFS
ncbi:MAG: RecX family transcriptional regulator [Calditerrivibrio sp.]|nr:RecX family transcriptional regulator [Calditerrivibrio sp.]